jgi:hypothetical protein
MTEGPAQGSAEAQPPTAVGTLLPRQNNQRRLPSAATLCLIPARRDSLAPQNHQDQRHAQHADDGGPDGQPPSVPLTPPENSVTSPPVAPVRTATVMGARCRQSGIFWGKPGAENILALRCIHSSRRFDEFWKARLNIRAACNAALPLAA